MSDNKAICEKVGKAFLSGDEKTLRTLVDPSFVVHETPCLPYGGEYRGVEGFMELGRRIQATFTDLEIEKLGILGHATDSMIAVLMRSSGRSIRTGKTYSTLILETWRFRDGKVIECMPFYFDAVAVAACDKP